MTVRSLSENDENAGVTEVVVKPVKFYGTAVFVSLLVPIIHWGYLDISTSIKNLKAKSDVNQSGHEIVAAYTEATNVFYLYWYSFTAIDFIREYFLSLLVLVVGYLLFQRIRRRNITKPASRD